MNDDRLDMLHRLLSGELAEDAPEAKELLSTEEGRRELAALREVQETLRRAAAEDAALESRVAALLAADRAAGRIGREGTGGAERDAWRQEIREFARSGRFGRRVVLHVAAAALVVVAAIGLTLTAERGGQGPAPVLLGTGAGELISPLGPLEPGGAPSTFLWRLELPRDGTYLLRITDADDPGRPPIEVRHLTEPRWEPDAGTVLPARFHWEVRALDAFDVVRARTATGVAWRSR